MLKDVNTSVHLLITNITGRVVYSALVEGDEKQIDLSGQPAGVYFINISGGTFNEQVKVVKD
jgi:hypothetical protein